jgi:hypothetical protein
VLQHLGTLALPGLGMPAPNRPRRSNAPTQARYYHRKAKRVAPRVEFNLTAVAPLVLK